MKLVWASFFFLILISAYAEESGTCGDNCQWTLDDEGILTIGGSGKMDDYGSLLDVPWYSSRGSIKKVVIEEGIIIKRDTR